MTPDELTLTSIDAMRHLATSQDMVTAVAFAARSGHDNTTCYRFVTALVMTDQLTNRFGWLDVLRRVKKLEADVYAQYMVKCAGGRVARSGPPAHLPQGGNRVRVVVRRALRCVGGRLVVRRRHQ